MKEILIYKWHGGFEIPVVCAVEFLKRKFGLEVTSLDPNSWVEVGTDRYHLDRDFNKYREDPILIEIIKEFGEYSLSDNDLVDKPFRIESYDDENYSYRIDESDEYGGFETLVLEPLIREDKIKELHQDFDKLMEYIKSTGVAVKPI